MSTEQAAEITLAINRDMKLDPQDQLSMLEVITDYFTLAILDNELEKDEENFDELDNYDGDSSSFITSDPADTTMNISVHFSRINRRLLHVPTKMCQILLDFAAHMDVKIKQTHSSIVMSLTEPKLHYYTG